ncbi:aldehyde dehydrogenase family protein [Sarocladium implicatum]|nr:aldehyde dehydrogenase family protein [Sarocladium implicatum]
MGPKASNGDSNYTVPFIINGEEISSERTFAVKSPALSEPSHKCSSASVHDAKNAVQAAADALPAWRGTPPIERRNIFLKAAEIMERRRAELVGYMLQETGDVESWCHFNLDVAIDFIKDVAGRCGAIEGAIPQTMDPNLTGLVLKEPYGVVLSIAPWNAPYILGTRSVVFPLGAGNTVVLKATELAPRCMWGIVSVFNEAGITQGALNMIAAEPAAAAEVTESLICNPHVKKINFTGSTAVGRIIGKLAGEQLKPLVQELGGKAPAIVWQDADLELAAKQCALGAFLNAGQVCMSTERVIVHKAIASKFKEAFASTVEKIFSSGPAAPILITSAGVEKNRKLVKDATSKGASLVYGKLDMTEASTTRMRPIILEKVTSDMEIYYGESFGPTVSLFEVETEEEAITMANDTEYGLTSAVFTEDLKRGLRFARAIETGAVHINGMSIHDESSLPHGGAKASGYGRFNAAHGLEEWVRTKTITFKN